MDMDLKTRSEKNLHENYGNYSSKEQNRNQQEPLLDYPEDFMIDEHSKDVLAHWQGPEYETYPRDQKWYLVATSLLIAIVIYALITDSPIMAITFILFGVVGYIYLQKKPRLLDFTISRNGVSAGNEIYEFDQIKSFCIFYEPPHTRTLSLKMKGGILPYIHFPIHQEDPSKIRKALMENIPEEQHSFEIIDTLERLLHI